MADFFDQQPSSFSDFGGGGFDDFGQTPGFDNGGNFGAPSHVSTQTPTLTIHEPPDDRYLPGYTQVDADGDKKVVGPRLKDLNVPFSLYGLPIPITFGVRRLYGNIIWAIPLRENVKKKKSGGGKGGGGPDQKVTTYSYFATFAVSFGKPGLPEMDQRDIIRIWANGTLIYDRRGTGRTTIGALNFNFYPGNPDQMPDPIIEAKQGVGQVPAYRDLMYLVIHDLPVGSFGNMPPAISVEIGDATEKDFIIENISNPSGHGTNGHVVDFDRQTYFQLTKHNQFSAPNVYIRGYNLLNNTYLGEVAVPNASIWSVNDATPEVATQISVKSLSLSYPHSYIKHLGYVVGTASDSAGGQCIQLIDVTSGQIVDQCGSNGFVNWQYPGEATTPTQGSAFIGLSPTKGVIPGPRFITPFKAQGLLYETNFLLVNTIYNNNGLLMFSYDYPLHVMAKLSDGNVTAACPGEETLLGTGSAYFAVGTTIRKVVCSYDSKLIPGPVPTPYNVQEDLSWKTGLPATIRHMIYYASDESLIVLCNNNTAHKIDIATKNILWSKTISSIPFVGDTNLWLGDFTAGTWAWAGFGTSGVPHELELTFGDFHVYSEVPGSAFVSVFGGGYHDSRSRSVVNRTDAGDGLPAGQEGLVAACSQIFYDRINDDRMLLSTFILGMAVLAGYDETDIEIDPNIDDTIDGAIINTGVSFRSTIDAIMAIYRIDVIESGGKIKFIRKALGSTTTNFTIPESDLLIEPNGTSESSTFNFRREEEVGVPQRVQLRFIDKSLGYQISMQMATRSQFITTNLSEEQITYEVPIIMTASEAKELAQRALWNAWTSRMSFSFRLGPKYLDMEPGDTAKVTADNIQYTIRCVELSYNFDKSITVKGQNFLSDEAITIVADPGDGYEYELPAFAGSEIFVLDVPLLRGSDDTSFTNSTFPLYWYVGPRLLEASWAGGTGYRADDLITYEEMGSNTEQGLVAVVATPPVVPDDLFETDETGTMTVFPYSGDKDLLVTATTDEILAGKNIAAYGKNGRWELIQFKDVTVNPDGSYTLSNLLRARRGTDKQVDLHQNGDFLILLDVSYTDMTTMFNTQISTAVDFKGVGFGQNADEALRNRVTIQGYGGLPWPPGNLDMERTIGGDGDITITWNRRSRTSGELLDGIENAPLTSYEENEYKITIWRWPHYNYTWNGSLWVGTLNSTDFVEITVADAETFALTDTLIRTHKLYEFLAPDNPAVEGTTFSAVSCDTIPENAAQNLIAADLGYDEWHAFTYLDMMIQQKTTLPNAGGYGPGRRERIYVRDDV